MSLYELRTKSKTVGVFAADELEALTAAGQFLEDGDEGNVEAVEIEEVEAYEPEGPG